MTISIGNEAIDGDLLTGRGTVGTTEAKLSAPDYIIHKWIAISADSGNTDDILVGCPGNAANGFILHAGESTPPIYVSNTSKIAVIGGDADQAYSWLAQ